MKNSLCLFVFIYGFVKLMKAFDTRVILSTLPCDVHVRLIKTNSKAIKIAKETINNQSKKYNSIKIYRENNFHVRRQVLRVKCL